MLISSCKATQAESLIPAFLEHSSPKSRTVLEQAIGDLLNSQAIKLANNVFTKTNTVIIDRYQPKDSRGNLLDGREIRQADTVSLLTGDGKCYVKHDQSGNIKRVNSINCKAK
jgi:hypothetical protein|tara:strand:- start:5 stop:343 length:339 start_codon:yes stop_codon:yes gene_type:complete